MIKVIIVILLFTSNIYAESCRYAEGSPRLIALSECPGTLKTLCKAEIICGDKNHSVVCNAGARNDCPGAGYCLMMAKKPIDAKKFAMDTVLENRKKIVASINATLPATIDKSKIDPGKLEAIIDTYAFIISKVNPKIKKENLKLALQKVIAKKGIKNGLLPVIAESILRAYHMGYSAVADIMNPLVAELNPGMAEVFKDQLRAPTSLGPGFATGLDMGNIPHLQAGLSKVMEGPDSPLKGLTIGDDSSEKVLDLGASFDQMFSSQAGIPDFEGANWGDPEARFTGMDKNNNPMFKEQGYDPQLAMGGGGDDIYLGAADSASTAPLSPSVYIGATALAVSGGLSAAGQLIAGGVALISGIILDDAISPPQGFSSGGTTDPNDDDSKSMGKPDDDSTVGIPEPKKVKKQLSQNPNAGLTKPSADDDAIESNFGNSKYLKLKKKNPGNIDPSIDDDESASGLTEDQIKAIEKSKDEGYTDPPENQEN